MNPPRWTKAINWSICLLSAIQISATIAEIFRENRQGHWEAWVSAIVRWAPILLAVPILLVATEKTRVDPGTWKPVTYVAYIFLMFSQVTCGAAGISVAGDGKGSRLITIASMLCLATLSAGAILIQLLHAPKGIHITALEIALKQAADQPSRSVDPIYPVIRQLQIAKVFVPLGSDRVDKLPNGSTHMQLRCWEKEGKPVIQAYASLRSLHEHLPNASHVEMFARDLIPIMPAGASLVLEPGQPHSLGLSAGVLADAFSCKAEGPYKSGTMTLEIDGVVFGSPAQDFCQFYSEFSKTLAHCKMLVAAYLILTIDKSSNDPPTLLVMLHTTGQSVEKFPGLMPPLKTVVNLHGIRTAVTIIKSESAVGKFVLEKLQPFYRSTETATIPR